MSGKKVLIVVSLATSLLMVGVGMIVALLPERVLNLSGSIQDVGLLASAFALSYLLVQMPVGYLADRLSVKPFLVLGYMLSAVAGLVFYFSESTETIFIGRFIQGAAEAPIWALGPALLSLAYPEAKGKVIGIYNASIHTGLTIGPLLGIYLFINDTSNSSLPFLLYAGLCLTGGLLVITLLPRLKLSSCRLVNNVPHIKELAGILKVRTQLITLAGIILYGAGYGICISVLPATLALEKGFDQVSNGIYFALFYVSISVSQLIIGPLSDRHGRAVYMTSGLILAASGFATFSFFSHPWIYLPLIITSIGLGVFCVSSMAYLNESAPGALKSSISASYFLAWGLGYFLGPLVIGLFSSGRYSQAGYILLALLIFVEAGVIARVIRLKN